MDHRQPADLRPVTSRVTSTSEIEVTSEPKATLAPPLPGCVSRIARVVLR
jgi:hypothetical protein